MEQLDVTCDMTAKISIFFSLSWHQVTDGKPTDHLFMFPPTPGSEIEKCK